MRGNGDRIVLIRLQRPEHIRPAVSRQPLKPGLLKGIDLDEPAFESCTVLKRLSGFPQKHFKSVEDR